MDTRLLEACISGNEQALYALVQHDQLILDRAVTWCEETPLHVAVLRGHFRLVKALLGLKRELASERDASGCLPLHLASAQGCAEVVCELLFVDAELCCRARDHCRRTPLHLGVMKGRLDVVRELIRVCPGSASQRLDRGETVFHLSVRYCRFEVLKLLVELLKDDYPRLLVASDVEGNTVLHFAAFFKQIETVKYLVSLEGVEAIAKQTNGNGHTALDVIEKSPRDFNSIEIMETLAQVGVRRGNGSDHNPTIVPDSPLPTSTNSWHTNTSSGIRSRIKGWFHLVCQVLTVNYQMDWIADAHGNLMVVATVIASIAFQAGLNPPGGVWQADTTDSLNCTKLDMCRAGTAVLKNATEFQFFYWCNSWALATSVGVVLLHFVGIPLKNKVGTWIVTLTTCFMLHNILLAYTFSTSMVVKPFKENMTMRLVVFAWRVMLMVVVSLHTTRFWYWLIFDKVMSFVRPGSILCRRKWMQTVAFWVGSIVTVSLFSSILMGINLTLFFGFGITTYMVMIATKGRKITRV